jgi:cell division septum initiation protein DivIVA|tara:strand:+ start:583 stop:828 length:246 start_codon:yes stop_codon:yes gene_type:complete
MADEGYNPMQKTLEDLQRENQHLKRDVQEAERINNSHKIANGKMNLLINNLQFENKKLKNKVTELEEQIKQKGSNDKAKIN